MALSAGEVLSGGFVRDGDQRQVVAIEGVGGATIPIAATTTPATANTTAGGSGTVTAGASQALIAANGTRKGLQVTVDPAATASAYFLLGSGTASATAFHFALGPGGSWDGTVSDVTWTGAVQVFSSGTPKVGVAEV